MSERLPGPSDVDVLIEMLVERELAREPRTQAGLHRLFRRVAEPGTWPERLRLRVRAAVVKGRETSAFDATWAEFVEAFENPVEEARPPHHPGAEAGSPRAVALPAPARPPRGARRGFWVVLGGVAAAGVLLTGIYTAAPTPDSRPRPPAGPAAITSKNLGPQDEPAFPGRSRIPKVTVEPSPPISDPLSAGLCVALVVAALALVVFGVRKRHVVDPPPPAGEPPAARRGRLRPLGLAVRPRAVHLDRREGNALVWGIGQYLSDEDSRKVDVPATVNATAREGGAPTFVFERARFHREVELWVDGAADAEHPELGRLGDEVQALLARSNLPAVRRGFWGLPEVLVDVEGRRLRPDDLPAHRAATRVAVLASGRAWTRVHRMVRGTPAFEALRRSLAKWPNLAIFDPTLAESGTLWADLGLSAHPPAALVAWLTGERPRERAVREVDRTALAAALALSSLPPDLQDAMTLAERVAPHLPRTAMLETLARWRRSDGRFALEPEERRRMLRWLMHAPRVQEAALDYWRGRLTPPPADEERLAPAEHQARRCARALVDLYSPREGVGEALRRALPELLRLSAACEKAIAEELRPLAPRGVGVTVVPDAEPVTLAFDLGRDLGFAERQALRALWPKEGGLARLATERRRPAGRGFVGAGLALGVALAAAALGLPAALRAGEPTIVELGTRPPDAVIEQVPGGWVVGRAGWTADIIIVKARERVVVNWDYTDSCRRVTPGTRVIWLCGPAGEVARREQTHTVLLSRGEDDPAARLLAAKLLDGGVTRSVHFNANINKPQISEGGFRLDFYSGVDGAITRVATPDWWSLAAVLDPVGGVPTPITLAWPHARIAGPEILVPLRAPMAESRLPVIAETALRPAMQYLTGGTFKMGSPPDEAAYFKRLYDRAGLNYNPTREEVLHDASVTALWFAATEVTQGQYEALMGKNPSRFDRPPDAARRRPVEAVSWHDAVRYCNALSQREGLAPAYAIEGTEEKATVRRVAGASGYRLPTEAEWEYAARAGAQTATYAGPLEVRGQNDAPILDAIAWYGGNSRAGYEGAYNSTGWPEKQYPDIERSGTQPVGGKKPNAFGLYDMLGNVWEWCEDLTAPYPDTSAPDYAGPEAGGSAVGRVSRGGSWADKAWYVRAADRNGWSPRFRVGDVGFRVVRAAARE